MHGPAGLGGFGVCEDHDHLTSSTGSAVTAGVDMLGISDVVTNAYEAAFPLFSFNRLEASTGVSKSVHLRYIEISGTERECGPLMIALSLL